MELSIKTIKKQAGTIGIVYDRKNNFFDILRFVFAGMVIYAHSYPLFYGKGSEGGDLIHWLTYGQTSAGPVAVGSFLAISGFLITQSILYSKGPLSYMTKRILRIMPALIAASILAAFVLGPLFTSLSLHDYFSAKVGGKSPIDYVFNSITFNIFDYQGRIKDVFAHNIYSPAINGSMWTLRHEFAMYLILALVFYLFARFIKFNRLIIAGTVIFLALAFLKVGFDFGLPYVDGNKSLWVIGNEYVYFMKLGVYFFSGSLLYLYRDKVKTSWGTVVLASAGIVISSSLHLLVYGLLLFLPYLIISLGTKLKFSAFKKYGDFSYGLYIYAFPVQQSIILAVGDRITHLQFLILGFVLTLATAIVSWKLIEEPCLKQKNRVGLLLEGKFKAGLLDLKKALFKPSVD